MTLAANTTSYETPGQAVRRMWPGTTTTDYALPQAWVDAQVVAGWDPRGQVVWAYTDAHHGFPLPLTPEAAYFLWATR